MRDYRTFDGSGEVSKNNKSLNVFLVIQVLKKYSDSEHPLTSGDICKHINKDFYQNKGEKEGGISRKTIESLMTRLRSQQVMPDLFSNDYADEEEKPDFFSELFYLGYQLHCVAKNPKTETYVPYDLYQDELESDPNNKTKKTPTHYYYYESVVTEPEMRILCDALETYNYLGVEDIALLNRKISVLRPLSGKKLLYKSQAKDKSVKGKDDRVLENVRILGEIIVDRKLAKIDYANYNEKGELVTRPGYPKIFLPDRMLFSNGYYYLVVYSKEREYPFNMRIDRIKGVEKIDDKLTGKERLEYCQEENKQSKSQYRLNHPVMFAGKMYKQVKMLLRTTVHNGIINAVIDIFGMNSKMRPATASDLKDYEKMLPPPMGHEAEKWIVLSVDTTIGGLVLFATQYCDSVFILSPKEVAQVIWNKLNIAGNFYGKLLK